MSTSTVRELKGEACIDLEDQPATKKQIVVSRTFSQRVTDQNLLNEAVSDYAARAGVKLRRERQACKLLSVFIRTNPFRKQDIQHRETVSIPFINPTNDTRDKLVATYVKFVRGTLAEEGMPSPLEGRR